ncbi:flagellar hook-associated protein FlgK [Bacillaceae bacterium]
MRSTFHGLEIGKRALYAQQSALSTTAHNIANANTEGYTRQRAVMQAANPIPYPGMTNDRAPGQIGTGVEVIQLQRIREGFLDLQFRGENVKLGYWEAKSDTLSKLEAIFNEPSDTGLQNTLDRFWQAWQDLAKEPESLAARDVVRQRGIAVVETFKHLAQSIDQHKADVANVIAVKVMEINSLAEQIKDLNAQIANIVPHGYQPNDLYDKRDVLIDRLSKLVDVSVKENSDGTVDVSLNLEDGTTQSLVAGTTFTELEVNNNAGVLSVRVKGTATGLALPEQRGELAGWLDSHNVVLTEMRQKLNTLAETIVNEINSVHQTGYNLDDIKNGGQDKNPFFDISGSPPDALTMTVNQAILDSLDNIAAAQEDPPGSGTSSEGNGENAQAIAALKFKVLNISGNQSTIDDFYRGMIAKVGVESQQAQRMRQNAEVLVNQVDTRRQSVSGVSLDEEMANMIKFQHAYNAAARMITAVDEILNKVINGMGRVGL